MQKITTIEELHEALESIEQLPDDSRIARLGILADIQNLIGDNEELSGIYKDCWPKRNSANKRLYLFSKNHNDGQDAFLRVLNLHD